MWYTSVNVHPELRTVVQSIMIMDADLAAAGLPAVHHYPCSTQVRLCFYIQGNLLKIRKDDEQEDRVMASSFVVGPQLKGVNLDFGPYVFSAVVFFHAGGFFRLTSMPLTGLLDQEVDAGIIFGAELYLLEQRLKESLDPREIGKHIELFLRKRLVNAREALPIDHAINSLVRSGGNLPIERAASLACLSTRQFERKCQERLGFNPKLFARLIRFTRAYIIKENQPRLKWAQIAYDLGYHDQMHLIRDFKTFAGFAPSVLDKKVDPDFQLVNILEQGL